MKFDLSVILPSVIAICALFTPIASAYLSNRHLQKLKEIEIKQENFKLVTLHKRELFENYLIVVGEFSYSKTQIQLSELTNAYYSILPYIPQDKTESFRLFSEAVIANDFKTEISAEQRRLLHSIIIPTIKAEIEKL
ncbi:hypothetical protein JZO86_06150 [Enterococcus ureasiticus]|uniref:hypothetical protein n=1 Tax=Enterococcus ureasiticus TaxID=903984 RepID=UPI001A8C6D04|nr:hypothetical protein [Enterococcus ureasiticus]MBO0473282.1 hypothetical protein [Enterococcus ureasiticus]